MDTKSRSQVLTTIANSILSLELSHPTRVGVDGITASGKSTFARELSEVLRSLTERKVISTTLDGFHHPRARRYERGRGSPGGYYYDAYNYQAVVEKLLLPLGPGGDLHYRTQVFSLSEDREVAIESQLAPENSILIVDGSFALRKELRNYWEIGIYLHVDYEIAEDRASIRDANDFGSAEEARQVTRFRYHEAHRLHTKLAEPTSFANFIVCQNDPGAPKLIIGKDFELNKRGLANE